MKGLNSVRRSAALGLSLLLPVAMAVMLSTAASAYGAANWQAAFSGNFNNLSGTGGSTGFWGWCDFAGGISSGNSADCSLSFYFFGIGGANGSTSFGPLTEQINGTAWDVEPTRFPVPTLPPNDFFITAGSLTFTGPVVAKAIAAGIIPPGCTVTGSTATCPIPNAEAAGIYAPDTGVPAAAGHFSLASVFELLGLTVPPGSHIDIQVTQIQ